MHVKMLTVIFMFQILGMLVLQFLIKMEMVFLILVLNLQTLVV